MATNAMYIIRNASFPNQSASLHVPNDVNDTTNSSTITTWHITNAFLLLSMISRIY